MANQKISALTALTGANVDALSDVLPIVDTSAGQTKKILVSELAQSILVLRTAQASTSGTSIDFTSVPAWVRRITMMLAGVSLSGTSALRFQLGDSGGVETTGYVGNNTIMISASTPTVAASTSGFDILINDASYVVSGQIIFTLIDPSTFLWAAAGQFIGQTGATTQYLTGGHKATSAALDRVRLTTINGSDTFDAGTVNVLQE